MKTVKRVDPSTLIDINKDWIENGRSILESMQIQPWKACDVAPMDFVLGEIVSNKIGQKKPFSEFYAYLVRCRAVRKLVKENRERLLFLKLILPKHDHDLVSLKITEIAATVKIKKDESIDWNDFYKAYQKNKTGIL